MARRLRNRGARLSREGWGLLALTVGLGLSAGLTGNNALYLALSAVLSLWVIDVVLGPWNLRHLEVRRELPAELFAETHGRGGFRVRNLRRWLPSVAVRLEDDRGDAAGTLERLPPGDDALVPAGWTFGGRGAVVLGRIRVGSGFPLGLWWRWQTLDRSAEVLVYPRPRPSEPRVQAGLSGTDGLEPAGRGATGDLDGLKDYVPGDPVRRIHWPTTARRSSAVIVLRTDEQADRVTVQVRNLHGRAWEHELSRACGEVLRGFQRGCRVGLELPDGRFEARGGLGWRRTLLEVLARQPERGA